MPQTTLNPGDAAEPAQMLTFLADWLTGAQEQAPADSLTAFAGHTAHTTGTPCADPHRFAFLLGVSDGEELFGEPTP